MRVNCTCVSIGVVALGLAMGIPGLAQVTGSLSGTIQDPHGMVVRGVRVVVTLPDSEAEEAATATTGSGAFFFPVLRPIFYDLKIEAPSFKSQTLKNVKIDPTTETTLPPIRLELGEQTTVVNVPAPPQTLQTSNAEVANTLTFDQVSALPLAQRDPLAPLGLLATLPGVQTNGRGPTTINGQSVSFANITYDGINIQDNFIRNASLDSADVLLGLHTDQISEATIVTSNAGTIYTGGSSQVAFSTPSTSSNALHGSLYWLNVPGGINAQLWQDNIAPATPKSIQLNQAGATAGGAFIKNKLYFFANYEAGLNGSTLTTEAFVPTAPFSSPNAKIQQVLSLIPSTPSGIFLGTQANGGTSHLGLARLDYLPSKKNVFSFSTSMNESTQDDPADSSPYLRHPNTSLQTVASFFAGSWRWTPTTRLTNEVRLGASVQRLDVLDPLRTQYPLLLFTDQALQSVNSPLAGVDPQGQSNRIYNYQDNLTYVVGRHSFQAGFSLQQYRESEYGLNFSSGKSTAATYSGFTSLLNSFIVPSYDVNTSGTLFFEFQPVSVTGAGAFSPNTPEVTKPSANLVSGYFQDNWKVTPSFSVNLGVRYDYLSPVEDKSGLAIIPYLGGGSAADAVYNPNLQFEFVGKNQGLYHSDKNNIAPYAGFAWQVGTRLPVVVRGAYSISFVNDDLLRNTGNFALANPYQLIGSQQSFGNSGIPFANAPTLAPPAFPGLNLPSLAGLLGGFVQPIPAVDPQLRTPYVQQANLGVETHVKGLLISVRYVGNRLVKGLLSVDRNQVQLSPQFLQFFAQNAATLASETGFAPNEAGEIARQIQLCTNEIGKPCFAGLGNQFANPLAASGINLLSNLGRSRYDSLQIAVSRRLSAGLSFTANYVYSKTLSNVDDYSQGAFDPYLDINNPKLDNAPAPFNLKHAFKSTAIYELPYGRGGSSAGLAHKVLGGWSISGIAIAQSGAPFSLLSQFGTFNTEANSVENTLSTTQTAGQIQQYFGIRESPGGALSYVNAPIGVFQEPNAGQVGSLQRRMFSGPGAFNLDLGIHKTIALNERFRVELRAESINVINKENWLVNDQFMVPGTPSSNGSQLFVGPVAGPQANSLQGFPAVTQWTPPRSFQFLLRLRF